METPEIYQFSAVYRPETGYVTGKVLRRIVEQVSSDFGLPVSEVEKALVFFEPQIHSYPHEYEFHSPVVELYRERLVRSPHDFASRSVSVEYLRGDPAEQALFITVEEGWQRLGR